jgi:hypothetical protein
MKTTSSTVFAARVADGNRSLKADGVAIRAILLSHSFPAATLSGTRSPPAAVVLAAIISGCGHPV